MPLSRELYAETVRRFKDPVFLTLLYLTRGRREDAEDLLQRTFERAWARRSTFCGDSIDEVKPWLLGIARHEYQTYLRKQRSQIRLSEACSREVERFVDPEKLTERIGTKSLETCLERLNPTDRHIIDLAYARSNPGKQSLESLRPMTDREIAAVLTEKAGFLWKIERVCKRRHIALSQLRRCVLGHGEGTGRQTPTEEGSGPMSEDPRLLEPVQRISDLELMALLEASDTQAQEWALVALAGNEANQAALNELVAVEGALLEDIWRRAEQVAAQRPATCVSPGLEARLLAIPEESPHQRREPSQLRLPGGWTVFSRPQAKREPRQTRGRYWVAQLAASLLVALGVLQAMQWYHSGGGLEAPSGIGTPSGVGAPSGIWTPSGIGAPSGFLQRGGPASKDNAIPFFLVVQRLDSPKTREAELVLVTPGTWKTEIPADYEIQLRVKRPEEADGAGKWSASGTLWGIPKTGTASRIPGGEWQISGDVTETNVALGQTVNLKGMTRVGLGPGDTIEYRVVRQDTTYRLVVVLAAREAEEHP